MIIIEGNSITMTRGDTLLVAVGMKTKQGESYVPAEGSTMRFALKHPKLKRDKSDYADETPIMVKPISIDTCVLRLNPEDTKQMACGEYVYDIELTRADGIVDTFIAHEPFILDYEVD